MKLSLQEYREIGRQLLEVDESMAKSMFRRAGLSKEEIEKFFVEKAAEKPVKKEELKISEKEIKELYEKMAEDFHGKFQDTGQTEYFDLARVYRRAAEEIKEKK